MPTPKPTDPPAASDSQAAKPTRPKRRVFARLAGALRTVWLMAGATFLALVLFEVALRLAFAAKDAWFPVPLVDPRLVAEGYDGADWVTTHFQEYQGLQAEWRPYVGHRLKPFNGRTIQVLPGGIRRTWQAPGDPAGRPRIWLLGGSAAWGLGARDDFTPASLLAKELHRRGHEVEVINYAEIGYVSMQEFIYLSLRLRSGERPDLVLVFGVSNDVLSALQNGQPGQPQNDDKRRRSFENERVPWRVIASGVRGLVAESAFNRLAQAIGARLRGRPAGGFSHDWQVPRLATDTLAMSIWRDYIETVRLVEALAESYGFEARFYWQPVLFTKRSPTPFEADELRKYEALAPLYRAVYALVRDDRVGDRPKHFADLSGLFDDDPGTVFVDFCHVTEPAGARIAAHVADDVEEWLQRRAEQSTSPR